MFKKLETSVIDETYFPEVPCEITSNSKKINMNSIIGRLSSLQKNLNFDQQQIVQNEINKELLNTHYKLHEQQETALDLLNNIVLSREQSRITKNYKTAIVKLSVKGILTPVVLVPLYFLNLVIIAPARYTSWILCGRWIYFFWGLIMLILLSVVSVSIIVYTHNQFPQLYDYILIMTTPTYKVMEIIYQPVFQFTKNCTESGLVIIKEHTFLTMETAKLKLYDITKSTVQYMHSTVFEWGSRTVKGVFVNFFGYF